MSELNAAVADPFSTPATAKITQRLGQWRLAWQCMSYDNLGALRDALRRNHIDDELYILRSACHPFLQGDDEYRCHEGKGWALVEFWSYDREHIEAWVRAVYKHIWGSEPQELIFVE